MVPRTMTVISWKVGQVILSISALLLQILRVITPFNEETNLLFRDILTSSAGGIFSFSEFDIECALKTLKLERKPQVLMALILNTLFMQAPYYSSCSVQSLTALFIPVHLLHWLYYYHPKRCRQRPSEHN